MFYYHDANKFQLHFSVHQSSMALIGWRAEAVFFLCSCQGCWHQFEVGSWQPDEMRGQLPRRGNYLWKIETSALSLHLTFLSHCICVDLVNLIPSSGQWFSPYVTEVGGSENQHLIIKSQRRTLLFDLEAWNFIRAGLFAACGEKPMELTFLLRINTTFGCDSCSLRRPPSTEAKVKFLLRETRTCMLSPQYPSELWAGKPFIHAQMIAFLRDVQPGTKPKGATGLLFRGEQVEEKTLSQPCTRKSRCSVGTTFVSASSRFHL